MMKQDDQDIVATVLRSMPPPDERADFVSRVNARIDEAAGWLGLADFRLWTLRLAPAAAALALVALFWSAPSPSRSSSSSSPSPSPSPSRSSSSSPSPAPFSPASPADWQTDVTGDALLEAALTPRGGSSVR